MDQSGGTWPCISKQKLVVCVCVCVCALRDVIGYWTGAGQSALSGPQYSLSLAARFDRRAFYLSSFMSYVCGMHNKMIHFHILHLGGDQSISITQ